MKICYLAPGNSSHTAKWVNHFVRQKHEIHLLTFEEPREILPAVIIHRLRARNSRSFRYLVATRQVKHIIAEVRPDLLHSHYASGYGTLGRLANFHPYILSVWGSDVFEFPEKSSLHRALIKKNLAAADRICSTSRYMAARTQTYYSGQVTITPFGVDCNEFRPRDMQSSSSGSEIVIGTVKTLEEKYGIEYLIRGVALLAKKYGPSKNLRLVIAGEGSLKSSLSKLANECGIGHITDFLGFVSHGEVAEILRNFSIFVAVSVFDSESFGVSAVEASACGLPVVVSDAGGLGEVVRDRVTGFVVARRSTEATATALAALIDDEGLRRKLGASGRMFVLENYEWLENASRMERLYDGLLKSSNSEVKRGGFPQAHAE